MVSRVADKVLHEVYDQLGQKPQVYFSTKKLSRHIQPDIFIAADPVSVETLVSAEAVLESYTKGN